MDLCGDRYGGVGCGRRGCSVCGQVVLLQATPEAPAGQPELRQRDEAVTSQHTPVFQPCRRVSGTGKFGGRPPLGASKGGS